MRDFASERRAAQEESSTPLRGVFQVLRLGEASYYGNANHFVEATYSLH